MSQVLRAETTSQMFRELVDRAVDHQQVSPSPDSVRYLVQLLDAFVHWDPLHEESETEPGQPLAEVFCRAIASDGLRRFQLLKLSGDLSLFTAGFCSDSCKGQAVDVDYYCQLGGTAYASAASDCASPDVAALFQELSAGFIRFADLLFEVSEQCAYTETSDDLRLHDRWLRIGSRHAVEKLRSRGVQVGSASGTVH